MLFLLIVFITLWCQDVWFFFHPCNSFCSALYHFWHVVSMMIKWNFNLVQTAVIIHGHLITWQDINLRRIPHVNIQQKAHERARKEWKKLSYRAKERGQSEHCLSRLHFVIHCFGKIKHLLYLHLYFSTKSTGALHVHYLECFSVCFILDGLVSVRAICTNGHFSCFTI